MYGRWVPVGDLSGDDIAESVWCDATVDSGAGAVEVFDGATGGLIVRFTGDPGAQFRAALAEVGDINGDGLVDLLVGAPGQQRAYLIDSPFADVAEPIVPTTRLNFVLTPPADALTTGFGSDVAGIHDLDGDVTLDGAVDGADVGLVLQTLGTRLYAPTAIDPGTCATGTYAVQALGETLCVEVIATSTLAAEIMIGDEQGGTIGPADIIQPDISNPCGRMIAACLADPRVVAAAQLVRTRCWPTGTPGTVIGKIYCSPCDERALSEHHGFARPSCGWFQNPSVNITICDRATDPCGTLAHELTHVSQVCSMGLFTASCEGFAIRWNGPRSTVCMELEAYNIAEGCGVASLRNCCKRACESVVKRWQSGAGHCTGCCEHLVDNGCCNGGLLSPGCVGSATGVCPEGWPHGY